MKRREKRMKRREKRREEEEEEEEEEKEEEGEMTREAAATWSKSTLTLSFPLIAINQSSDPAN